MEEQIVTTIETTIAETDKSHGTASVGDDVYIYRRLADRYDKTAIAMLNAKDEVVGYLNREVAENKILPYLKKGLNFRCVVTDKPDGEGDLPINISVLAPVAILSQVKTEDLLSTDKKKKRKSRKKRVK